jgi:VanZ family protein
LAHKQLLLILAIFWTCLIGYLCLDESSDLPSLSIGNIDKLAHFTFHFVFTLLWFFYFIYDKIKSKLITYAIVTFLMSMFYGIFIEWAQYTFTISRKADIFDVCANVFGAFMAIIASFYIQRKMK